MTNILSLEQAVELIVQLTETPVERKTLIAKCIDRQGLSKEELENTAPGATLNRIKCRLGYAIERALRSGVLKENEEKKLQRTEERQTAETTVETVNLDIAIEEKIKEILKTESLKKAEILQRITSTVSFPEKMKSAARDCKAGSVLADLVKKELVQKEGGLYSLPSKETPSERNKRLFNALSDEEFVDRTVQLFDRLYKKQGYTVKESKNVDGPQDGGIDGVIQATDLLGHPEKIILQVKHINASTKSVVPVREIREFVGVLSTDDAAKGIFVTNKKYQQETVRFAKKYADKAKYFILIDGEKWLELAEKCGYQLQDE